jgi:hypothetical protein
MLWTNLVWKGHLPVCPVAVECETCAEARKALTSQVRIPPHDSVWAARRPALRIG